MTLNNVLKAGQLKEHEASVEEIRRLFDAARRNLADTRAGNISAETRFDAAYKAIMQAALIALMACGFRPDTNRPGHHQTAVQSLSKTIDLSGERVAVLDTFRRKRNLSDYTAEDVDHASVGTMVEAATALLDEVNVWLLETRPDFIAPYRRDKVALPPGGLSCSKTLSRIKGILTPVQSSQCCPSVVLHPQMPAC